MVYVFNSPLRGVFLTSLVGWVLGWYNMASGSSAGVGFGLVGFACRSRWYAGGLDFL